MVTARFILVCITLIFISFSSSAESIRVAVSANFAKPIKSLLAEFSKIYPHQAQISVASTGVLYQQVRHGAPFDILLAADVRRPELLEQQGLIEANSRKTYAFGQIAIWSAIATDTSLNDLLTHKDKIAIAGPHLAPYGLAAKEALISLGLWQKYQNNIIVGTNINQTYQQTRTGAVRFGIVSYSQFLDSDIGSGQLIPIDLYTPIEQQLVIIKNAKNAQLARKFSEFLLLPDSQKLIQSYGYLLHQDIQTSKHALKFIDNRKHSFDKDQGSPKTLGANTENLKQTAQQKTSEHG